MSDLALILGVCVLAGGVYLSGIGAALILAGIGLIAIAVSAARRGL